MSESGAIVLTSVVCRSPDASWHRTAATRSPLLVVRHAEAIDPGNRTNYDFGY